MRQCVWGNHGYDVTEKGDGGAIGVGGWVGEVGGGVGESRTVEEPDPHYRPS